MTCPLCGAALHPDEVLAACQGCPGAAGCRLSRCPRCGYEWAQTSQIAHWLSTGWKRLRRLIVKRNAGTRGPRDAAHDRCRTSLPSEVDPCVIPLTRLAPGESAAIAFIHGSQHEVLRHLGAYGMVPGRKIRVRQLRPAVVVQMGETELAMDASIGKDIFVRRKIENSH